MIGPCIHSPGVTEILRRRRVALVTTPATRPDSAQRVEQTIRLVAKLLHSAKRVVKRRIRAVALVSQPEHHALRAPQVVTATERLYTQHALQVNMRLQDLANALHAVRTIFLAPKGRKLAVNAMIQASHEAIQ